VVKPNLPGARELWEKLRFILALTVLFLFGLNLPDPGVNRAAQGRMLSFTGPFATGPLATLTGGALPKLSVFALGVYPYLTATLIMSVLIAVIPPLKSIAHAGGWRAERLARYIRVLTAVVAVVEATAVVAYAATVRLATPHRQPLLAVHGLLPLATMVAVMTAGAVTVMWLAEIVTGQGFGKGAGLLMATQIAAVLPSEFWAVSKRKGIAVFALALVVVLATVVFKLFFDRAERRIPLTNSRTVTAAARRRGGWPETKVLLKLSQRETAINAAAAVLFLPVLAVQLWPGISWLRALQPYLHDESDPWYLAAFLMLIVVLTFVDARSSLNPTELADQLKREGWFIPGHRPGRPTREYLSCVLTRLSAVRAIYLVISALIPILGFAMLGTDKAFPYGGEAVVLILAVSLDAGTGMGYVVQTGPVVGFLA
jgi:preprotein translocase subunit SecY